MGCGRWLGGCLLLGGWLAGLPSRTPAGFAGPGRSGPSPAPGSGPPVVQTAGDVFEYVAGPLDWWQADGHCRQRFARLPTATSERERASLGRRLQPLHLQGAVWLEDGEARLQRPVQRRARPVPVLVFRNKTDTQFVKVLAEFPVMSAVSACAHVQWDHQAAEVSTVFSYAVPSFINEFQLRGFVDEDGLVRLAVILHGHHSPYLPAFRSDGQWHHLCVTWQQRNGSWALYADGREKATASGLLASQPIAGHGTFIIGQDQDSLGGAFKEKEAFSGNLTDLQVWQRALSRLQVAKVRCCTTIEEGLVFGWSHDILEVEGNIQQATVQFTCPGPTEECRVLALGPGDLAYASCLQALPFICHYKKDIYFQLKEMQSQSAPPLAARVNARAHAAVIPENVFQADAQDMNISAAAGFLQVVEAVLTEAEPPSLDAAALLGVFQLLRRVSEVEVQEVPEEQLVALEQLGQHYVEVAGRVLEAEIAEEWAKIKPIIGGPMAVVESIDKMAAGLQPLLSAKRPKVTIQSKNVGVQVWQVELGKMAASSAVYVPPSWEQHQPNQIEVPAEEMERLWARGLRQITVTNTWYGFGSLQLLLAGGRAVFEGTAMAVSDGGRRHLRTQVGSAIISSTLTSDYEEISTSVQFHLWHHRPQKGLPDQRVEPICAFWDFDRSPEAGGAWSAAGCSVVASHVEFTSCCCNHTTNFAVLLQVYEVQRSAEEESTLNTLSFVGCGVSFCALSVTFVLFLAVGLPKSERTTVHKNLIFALAAAEALLMFSELARTHQGTCLALTALLHFFFVAAFAWMLVEGLLLWSKVVAVNMSEDRRMRFYYVIGWGAPVVIVGITLATAFDRYVADGHCWLNVQTDVIWAFVGPVLLVLTVNTVVLFRVVMVTVASAQRRSRMLTPHSSLEKQIGLQIWATTKPVLVLLPVLGLTWGCGVLVHLSVTWAYVFIVLNSLQGLYIFLVYAVYNSEVRSAIQRMKEKKKALSFTNCSHPANYLSSPRNTSWETAKSSPENTALEKEPATKSGGKFSARSPAGLTSSIMSPEIPAVQLTAFKSAGF